MDKNNNKNYNQKSNNILTKISKRKQALLKPLSYKRLLIALCVILIVFLLLILRIGYFQFIKGGGLKELASRQQTTNRIISPNRGIIYDSNGKILAQSASVDTVTINPSRIKNNIKNTENKKQKEEEEKKLQEKLAKAFSEIFELDYDEVIKKVTSTSSLETIVKKVEQDKIDKLKSWMEDNEVTTGINIDADYKRYYPYGNLASNLIGFCNTDNVGQEGLELKWDNILSGTPGKIVTIESATFSLIPDKNENYVPAQNGSNITLTIDANIQSICEKYLKQACIENNCKNGGSIIVMRPSNGDILAMATYPNFDLNNPRTMPEGLVSNWDSLNSSDQLNSLYKLWRNKCVSDTYEPGSTFKVITAAVGLEEDIVQSDIQNSFNCVGYEMINGQKINCWTSGSHGSQTLRKALMNSCNPALMQLGKKIGSTTLYKYYNAFGLFNKTNIDTASEANSYFWNLNDVGNMELATMSFGQRFRVTPIQLITAISSIANNGTLVKPRIVKQIENTDTGAITTVEPVNVREVISKETSNKLMNILESVVTDGTGRYGAVKGYSVAGKTGTSEPDYSNPESGYVASYVGISPVENPEVVILVTLYHPPKSGSHQGGQIAGPVVSQILTEVLPYLGVPSDDLSQDNSLNLKKVTVPDVRNKTVAEAKKALENVGFTAIISGTDTSLLVTDQVPKPGTSLLSGSSVNIYSSGNEARVSVEVPNLKDMSFSQARNSLKSKKLNINVTGTGTVITQDPMAGTTVEEGTIINVTLQKQTHDIH